MPLSQLLSIRYGKEKFSIKIKGFESQCRFRSYYQSDDWVKCTPSQEYLPGLNATFAAIINPIAVKVLPSCQVATWSQCHFRSYYQSDFWQNHYHGLPEKRLNATFAAIINPMGRTVFVCEWTTTSQCHFRSYYQSDIADGLSRAAGCHASLNAAFAAIINPI